MSAKPIQHPGRWLLDNPENRKFKGYLLSIIKGTNSHARPRDDWMLRFTNPRGEVDFRTGFASPDRALQHARSLGRVRKLPARKTNNPEEDHMSRKTKPSARENRKLNKAIEAMRSGSNCALDDADPNALASVPAVKITRRKKSPRKRPARKSSKAKGTRR